MPNDARKADAAEVRRLTEELRRERNNTDRERRMAIMEKENYERERKKVIDYNHKLSKLNHDLKNEMSGLKKEVDAANAKLIEVADPYCNSAEMNRLRAVCCCLEKKLDEANAAIKALRDEIKALQDMRQDMRIDRDFHRDRADKMDKAYVTIREELTNARVDKQVLEVELGGVLVERDEARDRIKELNKELDKVTYERNESEDTVRKLRKQVNDCAKACGNIWSTGNLADEVKKLKEDVQMYQDANDRLHPLIEDILNAAKKLKEVFHD